MRAAQQPDPFWGDPALKARIAQNSGKGNWLAARPRYVRETYGEAAFARVAEALSTEARRCFLRPPMAFSWLPIGLLYEMDYAIVQGPMLGRVEQMELFGGEIAKYDLNWVYKAFLKLSSPEFLLRQAGLICRTYIKESSVKSEISEGRGHFTLTGAPMARYMCHYGIPGWLNAAIRASGGQNVVTKHYACLHDNGDNCKWELSWS